MHTTSFWWDLPEDTHARMAELRLDLGDALKGLAHLLGHVAPVFIMADPSDVRTMPMVKSPFTERPTLHIYDAYPGGVGYARRIFLQFDEIAAASLQHLLRCPCGQGCPSCVGAPVESGATARDGARWLLEAAAGEA